ncbi:MAG: aromatic ring-hydroxylating oxygenase subunit alpha [Frankia sp.]
MTDLLDQVRATCTVVDPRHGTTLPPDAYRSAEFYELERAKVFRPGWQGVCRVEQVAEPGSYYSIDLLGHPLVVTRDRDGDLHVLSRICRHRWMEVATGSGRANTLQCPYHLWTYGLDGRLLGAPLMTDVPGFDTREICLPHVRHEVWHGFVFVNLDGTAKPLAPQLAALEPQVENYEIDGYRSVYIADWDCPWDWKIMVENFMECYHHMGTHRQTVEDEYPAGLSWTDSGGELFSVLHSPKDPKYHDQPPFLPGSSRLLPEQLQEMVMVTIYPHFMLLLYPGLLYWMRALPDGPGRMRLQLDLCLSGAALTAPDRDRIQAKVVEAITAVFGEDMAMCAAVQRAINSGAVDGVGRLAPIERPLWELYRYLGRQLGLVTAGR